MGLFIRRRGGVAGAERALHLHAVQPATVFAANSVEDSDRAKSKTFMQVSRCQIAGIANHRDHLAEAALLAHRDQLTQQGFADARPCIALAR